jgi:DNA-directed RNA polymerase specialized sigma24 family protein
MATPEQQERAARLRSSLVLKAKELEEAEKAVDRLREQRRTLILAGREDATLSYVEMAKASGLSKPQVYKIVRDGFKEAPIGEWAKANADVEEPVSA